MSDETVDIIKDLTKELGKKYERRRPRWMREPPKVHSLTVESRRTRRVRNQARRRLRPRVRSRRKHGRPVGR